MTTNGQARADAFFAAFDANTTTLLGDGNQQPKSESEPSEANRVKPTDVEEGNAEPIKSELGAPGKQGVTAGRDRQLSGAAGSAGAAVLAPARSGSSKRKLGDANAGEPVLAGNRNVTAPSDCTSGERRDPYRSATPSELANPPTHDVVWRVSPRVENVDDWQGPVLVSARTAWAAWQKAQIEHDVRLAFSEVVCELWDPHTNPEMAVQGA